MTEEELYGEVPEHHVPPDLLALGKKTFDFCCRHYGDPSRPLKLRWIRKNKMDYVFAKILDTLQELGGNKVDILERGYEKTEPVYGMVKQRWTTGEKSRSVFVAVETPIERVIQVVGHEFYHARFSPAWFSNERDEQNANRFGERIEREMNQVAHEEAMKKWRKR